MSNYEIQKWMSWVADISNDVTYVQWLYGVNLHMNQWSKTQGNIQESYGNLVGVGIGVSNGNVGVCLCIDYWCV